MRVNVQKIPVGYVCVNKLQTHTCGPDSVVARETSSVIWESKDIAGELAGVFF